MVREYSTKYNIDKRHMKASLFSSHIAVLCLCLIILSNSLKCSILRLDYCDVEFQIACQFALNQEDAFSIAFWCLEEVKYYFQSGHLMYTNLSPSPFFNFFLKHYIPSAICPLLTTPRPSCHIHSSVSFQKRIMPFQDIK